MMVSLFLEIAVANALPKGKSFRANWIAGWKSSLHGDSMAIFHGDRVPSHTHGSPLVWRWTTLLPNIINVM